LHLSFRCGPDSIYSCIIKGDLKGDLRALAESGEDILEHSISSRVEKEFR
jgi:hypothetical protein